MISILALAAAASLPHGEAPRTDSIGDRDRPAEARRRDDNESARALANLASYISDLDYPAAAISAGEQGTVGFLLDIGPDGLVSNCRILSSSGSATLDETTCRIMHDRPRFRPARDSEGRAVADQLKARVRWVLPASTEI